MYDATLRTFTFGELLDGAFTLYRRNFVTLFGVALAPQVPIVIYWLLVPFWLGPVEPGTTSVAELVLMPYTIFATVLVFGALAIVADRTYASVGVGIGEALRAGLGRWVSLAIALGLAWLMFVVGFILLIVPGLIVMAMYFAVLPVAVLEKRGPLASMGRSRKLSRGARTRILGVLIVAWLIILLPAAAMWALGGAGFAAGAILTDAGLDALSSVWFLSLFQAAGPIISALTMPYFVLVTVLLYFDRRARTEAPDLEVELDRITGEA